jgi:hypothetical protein
MKLNSLRLPALLAVLLLPACATAPKFTTSVADTQTRVGSVYIYSFLDLREKELGPRNIAEIERQLADTLSTHGVRSKQLWFNRAPVRGEIALNQEKRGNWFLDLGTSVRVPVNEVIASNAEDEKAFAPQCRLVVFPLDTTQTGTGVIFQMRWVLADIATQKVLWSATSTTNNMNMWKNDEYPEKRAFMLVDGLVKELQRVGVFK